jgi:tyramine---L-glutamate ligase
MQVFAGELLTSGGWPDPSPSQSLLREGRAIISALLCDLSAIKNVSVKTTWSARIPPPKIKGVEFIATTSIADERNQFEKLAAQADATWFIAPEIDGTLTTRQIIVSTLGGRWIGPEAHALEIASDKLRFAQHLKSHQIRTIPTRTIRNVEEIESVNFPVIVKPRFGAGSLDVQFMDGTNPLFSLEQFPDSSCEFIVQPMIVGRAVSVGVIVRAESSDCDLFPVCEQHLSADGQFSYLGGQLPVNLAGRKDIESAISQLVLHTCQSIPGLEGYIGFDLILPDKSPEKPVVVELNPRLTTSYLGYRKITSVNLAERILFPENVVQPIGWNRLSVTFKPDGTILANR